MQAIQTLPTLVARRRGDLRTLLDACRAQAATLARRWRAARTLTALDGLDDATLRDLGLARAELASVAAELHAETTRTRRLRGAVESN
jgi:uncharacterized protein YjiS (DUF1127 family)